MSPEINLKLEKLLKLKRHERAPLDFWESFDEQLQQKSWHTLGSEQKAQSKQVLKTGFKVFISTAAMALALLLGLYLSLTEAPESPNEAVMVFPVPDAYKFTFGALRWSQAPATLAHQIITPSRKIFAPEADGVAFVQNEMYQRSAKPTMLTHSGHY